MKRSWNYRRHHEERMEAHALKLLRSWNWVWWVDEEDLRRMARRHRDDFTRCSCEMCCNPRRSSFSDEWTKLTIQERREFQDSLEDFLP